MIKAFSQFKMSLKLTSGFGIVLELHDSSKSVEDFFSTSTRRKTDFHDHAVTQILKSEKNKIKLSFDGQTMLKDKELF